MKFQSLTIIKDKELIRLMHQSGCAGLLTGIESISRANVKQIHKSWNTVGIGYDEALKIARDNGIAIVGLFILVMDEDMPESLSELLEFTIREQFFDVWHAFTFLTMNLPADKEEQMRFGKALGAC